MWEAKKLELYLEAAQICICDIGNQNTSILGCDALAKLVFHGGVGEIGGNKILLTDESTKFFLDFGTSFSGQSLYYTEYLDPRKLALIDELIEFDLLPKIPSIYRTDYLRHTNENHPLIGEDGTLDAVLISHAHIDHIGMIPWLRP